MTTTPDTPAGGAVLVIDMCPHLRTTVSVGPTTDQRNHYCPDCRSSWITHPERLAIHPPATVSADAVLALAAAACKAAKELDQYGAMDSAATLDAAIKPVRNELEALKEKAK